MSVPTAARAGAAPTMRSPISVWRLMKAHSVSVRRSGLPRIDSGIAILPMSCSCPASAMRSSDSPLGPSEHAELVAAEAVGSAPRLDDPLESASEADEQRVARGMAEGVVVTLETVEIEHQDDR